MSYCNGDCKYLDEKKHCCMKYRRKLAYCRRTGNIAFTVHEKCRGCQKDEPVQMAWKNEWDDPCTERVWHECGKCKGRVSKKAGACRHCGAVFENAPEGGGAAV